MLNKIIWLKTYVSVRRYVLEDALQSAFAMMAHEPKCKIVSGQPFSCLTCMCKVLSGGWQWSLHMLSISSSWIQF